MFKRKKESWKDILGMFYVNVPFDIFYSKGVGFWTEKTPLPKLEINQHETESILKFLNDHGFIEGYKDSLLPTQMHITNEGIDIILKIREGNNHNKSQYITSMLTLIIILLTLWSAAKTPPSSIIDWIFLPAIIIILVVLNIDLRRK
ncbi:MAG: hypothetical protein WA139_00070 [Candidatus Aenigmatarchaeota archaeon]